MERISRREFIWPYLPGFPLALGLLAQACDSEVLQRPPQPQLLNPQILQMGDVLTFDRYAFLLRSNKAYEILDLERYKRATKLEQYGRRIMPATIDELENYPLGQIPTSGGLGIIDPFTGELKDANQFGGEMLIFWAGFMTDEGMPYNEIVPTEDTFVEMRGEFKKYAFGLADSLFFTYGERGLDRYKAVHTGRSPKDNIANALEYFEIIKETFPLVQFNFIAHSLGGIFALEAARRHQDAINSLTLINSPIRGIRRTWDRALKTQIARELLRPYIGDEQVTGYLFNRWDDKTFQKDLDAFTLFFTGMGRGLTVVVSEDDPIVPEESATVKGAKEIILSVGNLPLLKYLEAHGRPLQNRGVKSAIVGNIGRNLAA